MVEGTRPCPPRPDRVDPPLPRRTPPSSSPGIPPPPPPVSSDRSVRALFIAPGASLRQAPLPGNGLRAGSFPGACTGHRFGHGGFDEVARTSGDMVAERSRVQIGIRAPTAASRGRRRQRCATKSGRVEPGFARAARKRSESLWRRQIWGGRWSRVRRRGGSSPVSSFDHDSSPQDVLCRRVGASSRTALAAAPREPVDFERPAARRRFCGSCWGEHPPPPPTPNEHHVCVLFHPPARHPPSSRVLWNASEEIGEPFDIVLITGPAEGSRRAIGPVPRQPAWDRVPRRRARLRPSFVFESGQQRDPACISPTSIPGRGPLTAPLGSTESRADIYQLVVSFAPWARARDAAVFSVDAGQAFAPGQDERSPRGALSRPIGPRSIWPTRLAYRPWLLGERFTVAGRAGAPIVPPRAALP